ncbi:Alpha/Beta hydrolase protein [Lentinula aciculospora]|uniref:Alpha/Beta hydrolase protein n=1 Tax=Lentinula aciculospora TaxID=153920 RepID=A0A9W9AE30_9AGAR|nr:Alpha/Beta hydrolase protein [Lentinula aciculospora]
MHGKAVSYHLRTAVATGLAANPPDMTRLTLCLSVLLPPTLAFATVHSRIPRAINNAPVIDIGYAKYQGVFDSANNGTNYLGIRYAEPPTGDLRWRAPQSPANDSNVVQPASTQPPPCFQAPTGEASTNPLETLSKRASAPGTPTEDCLYLNVYFPGDTIPTKTLPTLVWIHGGGYIMGGADTFTGSDLVREANNEIVLVIIQYRLGLFGFLAGSEVKENGDLNAGLREYLPPEIFDLTKSLRYDGCKLISRNLEGILRKLPSGANLQACAGSVLQHIVARDGQTSPQLFRGAITSSTFLPSQYMYNDSVPELLYSEVVSQTNCSSADDSLACLRAADAHTLGTVNNDINAGGFFGTFLFVPVVDGTFIAQRPTEALKQRKVNGNALLSITNTNEGTVFVNQTDPITNVKLYTSTLFPKLGSQQANETAQLYAALGTPLQQDDLIMGELDGRESLRSRLQHTELTWSTILREFLAAFQGAFMSFVVSQDPNDKISSTITPFWKLYSEGNTEMIFNRTVNAQPDIHVDNIGTDLLERCNFWDSIGALTGQ